MSSPLPSSPLPPPPSLSSPPSYNLSLLIIFSLLAIVAVVTTSIRLLLRSRGPTTSTTSVATSAATAAPSNATLVPSLPLLALSALPPHRSPADCAVCLSPFRRDETLRALPACRHAFHTACVDRWIESTPSCPLCRAPIDDRPVEADATGNVDMSSWLKEYVDRTVGSTATSTPFSSARVSGETVSLDVVDGEESFRSLETGGYFASSYNWMAGAVP